MEDTYKTVEAIAEGLYKEKGSRFISYIYPVSDEEEIKEIIAGLKTQYYDARHHCYAYCLGTDRLRFRANDDGEPSFTAGKPILGQIHAHELTNVLIVVIRYFGGTKLGVSGLIQAYKEAAFDAIAHATIIEKTVNELLRIRFSYLVMNDVMKVLKEEEPEILERTFEMDCDMLLSIRKKDAIRLQERLLKIESLNLEIPET